MPIPPSKSGIFGELSQGFRFFLFFKRKLGRACRQPLRGPEKKGGLLKVMSNVILKVNKYLRGIMPSITSLLHFIPDGLEWNGKEEGVFDEWLSYFVLFTDRISYAITGSHPHFIPSTPKTAAQKQQIVTYEFPLNIFQNYYTP